MQPYLLGIDIGGTKILAGVIDQESQVLARAKTKTKAADGSEAVIERVVNTAREALQTAQIVTAAVQFVGAGAPGPLDTAAGIILEAPNLGWRNVPLASILKGQLGIETRLVNDVNAGTWGEYQLGAGRSARSCLGVFVGTGIGGGIVLNGELYEGATGTAGEIGHMCLDPKGPACGCGKRGCLEAFASRTAMTRDIWAEIRDGNKSKVIDKDDQRKQIRSSQLLKGVEAKDKVVIEALERAAKYLGIGLASAAHLLNPERLILGGGVVEALGDWFSDRVRRAFVDRAFERVGAATLIVEAELGDDAGVIGAALLAQRAFQHSEVSLTSLQN